MAMSQQTQRGSLGTFPLFAAFRVDRGKWIDKAGQRRRVAGMAPIG
jgi:hypothetical protein